MNRFLNMPMVLAAFILAASVFAAQLWVSASCSVAYAAASSDFCYRTSVDINNTTGADLSAYPVAVTVNVFDLIAGGRVNDFAWDIFAADPSNIEVESMAQSIATDADKTIFIVATVPDTQTITYNLYTGNAEYIRDQGMYFHQASGADLVTVTDHADFDLTDNFEIIVDLSTTTPDAATYIVDKVSGNTGYRVHTTTTGAGKLAFTVGNGAATSTLEADFDGIEYAKATFDAGAASDMDISYWVSGAWVSQADQDAAYASVAVNALNIGIGDAVVTAAAYTGHIYSVEIRDNVGAASYSKVDQWNFSPASITETQTGEPGNSYTWLGTVAGVVTHSAAYSLVHTQASVTATVGPTALNTGSASVIASRTTADLIGATNIGGTTGFTTVPLGSERWRSFPVLGTVIFDFIIDDTTIATTALKFAITALFAILFGGVAFKYIGGSIGLFAFMITFVGMFGGAVAVEFLPPWWGVVPGVVMMILFMFIRPRFSQ